MENHLSAAAADPRQRGETTERDRLRIYTTLLTRAVAAVAVAAAGLWAAHRLATGFLIVFAGILLAVFLTKTSRAIERRLGLSYAAALSLVVAGFALLFAGAGYLMGNRIAEQLTDFSEQFTSASERVWERVEGLGLGRWLGEGSAGDSGEFPAKKWMLSSARWGVAGFLTAVGGATLVVFLGIYMAVRPETYRGGLVRLFAPRRRPRLDETLINVGDALWAWMAGRLLAMAVVAVSSTAGLWLIGIPLPATLGAFAGLMNFVPNLGPLVASVPPLIFGLAQGGSAALYVAGLYLTIQLLESYLMTPLIDQEQVQLPPALTLAAQLLLGTLAGFMGLLLATPLVAAAKVLITELYIKDVLEKRGAIASLETAPSPSDLRRSSGGVA